MLAIYAGLTFLALLFRTNRRYVIKEKLDSLSARRARKSQSRSKYEGTEPSSDAPLDNLSKNYRNDEKSFGAVAPISAFEGPMTHPNLRRRSRQPEEELLEKNRFRELFERTKARTIAIGALVGTAALRWLNNFREYREAKYEDTKYQLGKLDTNKKIAALLVALVLSIFVVAAIVSLPVSSPVNTQNNQAGPPAVLDDTDEGSESSASDGNLGNEGQETNNQSGAAEPNNVSPSPTSPSNTTTEPTNNTQSSPTSSSSDDEFSGSPGTVGGSGGDTTDGSTNNDSSGDNTSGSDGNNSGSGGDEGNCIVNDALGTATDELTVCD